MKRALLAPLAAFSLTACAPQLQTQPVQIWEGGGRVLLREQSYRLTFTANPQTHEINGTFENRRSGDRFLAVGTLLPTDGGSELTAQIVAGGGAKLGASVLGVGVSGVALKADALLSGRVAGGVFSGSLRVNGISYPLELRRVK